MKCDICHSKRAYYNYEGKIASRCGSCKEKNMINVVSKRCPCPNSKLPSFNYEGLKPKYCINCKKPDMVNTSNKKCENCNIRRASFSVKNEKKCSLCKICADMKNKEVYNIVVKKCMYDKCKDPARYNYKNCGSRKALYCKAHAEKSMVDIRSQSEMCVSCNDVKATFSKNNGRASHCRACVDKLSDKDLYEDVKNKKCSKCLTIRENPQYKPYCATCFHTANLSM